MPWLVFTCVFDFFDRPAHGVRIRSGVTFQVFLGELDHFSDHVSADITVLAGTQASFVDAGVITEAKLTGHFVFQVVQTGFCALDSRLVGAAGHCKTSFVFCVSILSLR